MEPPTARTGRIEYLDLSGECEPRGDVPSVLVVESDPRTRSLIAATLSSDHRLERARDGEVALGLLEEQRFDCVLLSVQIREAEVAALLAAVRRISPPIPVIVMCPAASIATATEAIRRGAADLVIKDVEIRSLPERISRAIKQGGTPDCTLGPPVCLVAGKGKRMREVIRIARRVASSPIPVLLLGETGTGKELFARWIHHMSDRAEQPFVGLNLAAIPSDLIESTLFGHEKGAFTGAQNRRQGKFTQAQAGTLLLDEIAELKYELQSKLLRVLQEGEYERVGGSQTLRNEARIIAATNRDVFSAVRKGEFRDDLFYRLNAVTISLPPLRERREDVPELVRLFLGKHNRLCGTSVRDVSAEAMQALMEHSWPGNIRELENAVQRSVILADGPTVKVEDLFDLDTPFLDKLTQETADRQGTLADLEQHYIEEILRRTGGHQGQAVKILGIDRKTLYNKIMKYGLGRSLNRSAVAADAGC